MLKQTIVIFALAAITCVVVSGLQDPNKVKDKDGGGHGWFGRVFGKHKLSKDEEHKPVEVKKHFYDGETCPDVMNGLDCRQCCEANGKTAEFSRIETEKFFSAHESWGGNEIFLCFCTKGHPK